MRRSTVLVLSLLGLAVARPAVAQPPTPPAPRPEDVSSVDAIMAAVYDVISGPAGQVRNWDRMRSLFLPGARLIPTGRTPDGKHTSRVWTLEEYIANAGPRLEEMGFFEREIGRVQEQYGNIVHLMSAYDSKRKADDAQPFARGVNSFQLMNDGSRWWVVTIYWQAETPDNPVPPRFLGRR
jgi:hypothetical protein